MGIPQGNPTAFPSIADYVKHPSVFLYKWGHLCLGKHQSPQMQLTTLSAFVFCAVSSVVGLSIPSGARRELDTLVAFDSDIRARNLADPLVSFDSDIRAHKLVDPLVAFDSDIRARKLADPLVPFDEVIDARKLADPLVPFDEVIDARKLADPLVPFDEVIDARKQADPLVSFDFDICDRGLADPLEDALSLTTPSSCREQADNLSPAPLGAPTSAPRSLHSGAIVLFRAQRLRRERDPLRGPPDAEWRPALWSSANSTAAYTTAFAACLSACSPCVLAAEAVVERLHPVYHDTRDTPIFPPTIPIFGQPQCSARARPSPFDIRLCTIVTSRFAPYPSIPYHSTEAASPWTSRLLPRAYPSPSPSYI
ncbi:hypothetical protein C8J57DRAFT_1528615 [Mycena rebaudengoi]|nr:hypothetical protein C8J57DRAFT_1528615 [Mycena rebaudengoi]